QGTGRITGMVAVVIGAGMWMDTKRPAVLVADIGALVGVLGPAGRALSKGKGSGFVAGIWMENDGMPM
ncbi:MAG: hypothetical protein ABF248_02785, partial [Yoonia sp.]